MKALPRRKFLLRLLVGFIGGAMLATLVSCTLVHRGYALTDPQALRDGQAVLMFIPSFPLATFAGAAAGSALAVHRWRHGGVLNVLAALACLACTALVVLLAHGSASSRSPDTAEFAQTLLAPWIAGPLLVCGALSALSSVLCMLRRDGASAHPQENGAA